MNIYEKEQERLETYKLSQEFTDKYNEIKQHILKNSELYIPNTDPVLANYYSDVINAIRRTNKLNWQLSTEPSDVFILEDGDLVMICYDDDSTLFEPKSEMFGNSKYYLRTLNCSCAVEASFSDENSLISLLAWIPCTMHQTNIVSLPELLLENNISHA